MENNKLLYNMHTKLENESFSLFFKNKFQGQKLVKGRNGSLALGFN